MDCAGLTPDFPLLSPSLPQGSLRGGYSTCIRLAAMVAQAQREGKCAPTLTVNKRKIYLLRAACGADAQRVVALPGLHVREPIAVPHLNVVVASSYHLKHDARVDVAFVSVAVPVVKNLGAGAVIEPEAGCIAAELAMNVECLDNIGAPGLGGEVIVTIRWLSNQAPSDGLC